MLNRAMRALDELLPDFDVNETHSVALRVGPDRAVAALLALPIDADPIVRVLFRVRGLRGGLPISTALTRMGFAELARAPGEVVFGGAGRPWRPTERVRPFADARPGDVRIAVDFRSNGAHVSTETRIAATDDAARRAFRRYWLVVGPFSAVTRRRWLAALQRGLT